MRDKLILAVKGFCMGAADVVPGVSGGTMAFILGIYERFLAALKSFDSVWLKYVVTLQVKPAIQYPHFGFLIPLALGLFSALVFFTRVIPIPQLLHTHPEPIYGLFFGLIIGSVITLLPQLERFDRISSFFVTLGIALGWTVVNLVPTSTPDTPVFIFFSGMLAISAMLLPGISGSFILLMLRKYETIFSGIGRFDLWIIAPFALGALAGLIVFSRFLSWLLSHYHRETLATIIGILIGSLWVIWPFQIRKYEVIREKERLISSTPYFPDSLSQPVSFAILMAIIGTVAVLVINYLATKKTSSPAT